METQTISTTNIAPTVWFHNPSLNIKCIFFKTCNYFTYFFCNNFKILFLRSYRREKLRNNIIWRSQHFNFFSINCMACHQLRKGSLGGPIMPRLERLYWRLSCPDYRCGLRDFELKNAWQKDGTSWRSSSKEIDEKEIIYQLLTLLQLAINKNK